MTTEDSQALIGLVSLIGRLVDLQYAILKGDLEDADRQASDLSVEARMVTSSIRVAYRKSQERG